ncbi:hypothetical protein [Acinetobacter calcoaceticus]|uniref:hypothetical protein n=1 Tax=Acinetobacter calcoaceticus TaxID=471 RepID=UPI003AF4F581
MEWEQDTSLVKLNEWHICFDAQNGKKFSAMPVMIDSHIKWLVDPWCRKDKDQLIVRVTHFIHYPDDPVC